MTGPVLDPSAPAAVGAPLVDEPTDEPPPGPARPDAAVAPHRPGPGDWAVVAGLGLLAAWVAVVAVLFLPLHVGSVPVPLSALLPVALLAWAPRAAYRLTHRMAAAALVVLSWFAVSVFLVLVRNDLYLNYPVTVYLGQWRVMLLLGLGALTAAATLGLLWGDHLRDAPARRAAAADRSDPPADPDPDPPSRSEPPA